MTDATQVMLILINLIRNIITTMHNFYNHIYIWGSVKLLDFIITIILLGALIPVIMTAPNRVKIEKRKGKDKK